MSKPVRAGEHPPRDESDEVRVRITTVGEIPVVQSGPVLYGHQGGKPVECTMMVVPKGLAQELTPIVATAGASGPHLAAEPPKAAPRWSKPYSWDQWGRWTSKGRSHVENYFKSKGIRYNAHAKGAVYVVLDDLPEYIRQQLPE